MSRTSVLEVTCDVHHFLTPLLFGQYPQGGTGRSVEGRLNVARWLSSFPHQPIGVGVTFCSATCLFMRVHQS